MIGRFVRRYFSSKAAAQQRPTKVIENLLKEHGPMTVNNCWKLAEPAGIKSKTHMKTMLHWLVERERVQITCNHLKHGQKTPAQTRGGKQLKSGQGFKEFLFGIKQKGTKKKLKGIDEDWDEVEDGELASEAPEQSKVETASGKTAEA
ncbi:hypothetical protein KP509_19G030000 [Ceratopteris richardii]|uniref:Uncharacterized protein n=1 Tax=Ceratopteris richardii TaxID=49495 RepID=A0A8T2SM56_CERRI|nr:hypothetical protein KP509_19G030000 [Ceratopteris richardii]